ncbi:hypothetical protein, partial [Diaphorobacter sp.]|uniref:rolling circle replication-associated protein n=1 Tax=Diaphorobacter sp. TaxID=1934310 RepID=UPI00338F2D5A
VLMACPVAHLLHARSTPGMVRAARRAHARSVAAFERRAAQQEARSASGLVSVSTTCRGVPAVVAFSENCIQIDRHASRVTRLRKSLGVAAKSLHNAGPLNQQVWMQTLTYAGDNGQWRPEHISRFLDGLRKWHYSRTGSKKVRYAWVAELQQRGVIHYHVVVWLAGGLTPPKPDTAWRRVDAKGIAHVEPPMWPHGMSNRLKATAPIAYLMKYASKVESKNVGNFPHGARIHGCGGLDADGRAIRRWVLWPAYVQGNASVQDRYRPAPGGGYRCDETGELLLSEFAPTGGGFSSFIRVRHTPRRIDPAGPFSWLPSPSPQP